ncbi:MAG: LytTR family transcriptional regulator [Lawsonibacter sp.]|nr:LytTR family transcriptional regulator [Lawsonibacter sp.]
MEVEIKVEPGRLEPKMVILAGEDSEELRRLAEQLSRLPLGPIPVSRGEEKRLLPQREFLRFYTDGKGVSAQTAEETFAVRLRLYELEERLDATRFVRISNGEIINLDRVTAVDLSLSGTICMTLDGAVHAYVSRRYVKKIKETLNLGRRRRHEESE